MQSATRNSRVSAALGVWLVLGTAGSGIASGSRGRVDENDPTYQLYQLLDSTRGGVVKHLCVLADVYTDSSGTEYRHVLRLEYDKGRAFGRLELYVRSVGKMSSDQLATYTPEQIFDFGESDQEKFMKTDPGPFGQTGDLFLAAGDDGPLHSVPITDAARKQYADFITQYILPAVKGGTAP
ncbi:MAG TPA: hypothetical protein VL523_03870 [Terriglobia bacterium]|nr:hypothetical protein [Terriglobia bacterium]